MSSDTDDRRSGSRGPAAPHRTTLAGIPFALLLLVILGLGMAAILIVNTSIQQQESTLEDLRASAQAAGYHQDLLQGEVDQLGTTTVLAAKAANLGMVPNPNPVIIQMPSGQVHGTPTPATGTEMPGVAVASAVPSPSSEISIVASGEPATTQPTAESGAAPSSTPTSSASAGAMSTAPAGATNTAPAGATNTATPGAAAGPQPGSSDAPSGASTTGTP